MPFSLTTDGDFDFEGQKLIHIDAATNRADVINKSYIDGKVEVFPKACEKEVDTITSQIVNDIYNQILQMKITKP